MGFVKLTTEEHVAVLTIDRPEALNALSSQVLDDLDAALDTVAAEEQIYAVIITGSGRSFVAGADIAEMQSMSAIEGMALAKKGNAVMLKIENLYKPVIAAVNGFALGGGCELSMACDIRLASEKAKFGQPEVGLGITPGFGGTQRLARTVGTGRAMELILTGKVISAAEAEKIGLVNAVYAPDELMEQAMAMAKTIAAQAPVAVCQSKLCIRKGMQTDITTGIAFEAEAFGLCFSTADQTEGMSAFLEKRKEKKFIGK